MICARHSSERSAVSRSIAAASMLLACGSSDTVTLVSDVETRSIDMPCSLKIWNASARKPTSCHMPGLSSDTSVMPFLTHTALTLADESAVVAAMCVPSRSGTCVAYT